MRKMQLVDNKATFRLNTGRAVPAKLAANVCSAACEHIFITGRSDLRAVARQFIGLTEDETFEICVRAMEEAVRALALTMPAAPAPVRAEATALIGDMRREYTCAA